MKIQCCFKEEVPTHPQYAPLSNYRYDTRARQNRAPPSSSQTNLIEDRVSELVKYVGIPVAQLQQRHDALQSWCRGILLEKIKASQPRPADSGTQSRQSKTQRQSGWGAMELLIYQLTKARRQLGKKTQRQRGWGPRR